MALTRENFNNFYESTVRHINTGSFGKVGGTQEKNLSELLKELHKEILGNLKELNFTSKVAFAFIICKIMNLHHVKFKEDGESFEDFKEKCLDLAIKKNNDYGPFNIYSTGVPGLFVRMNDKLARLRNLIDNNKELMVQDESIRDTFMDLFNYSVFGGMLIDDLWCTEEEKSEWERITS